MTCFKTLLFICLTLTLAGCSARKRNNSSPVINSISKDNENILSIHKAGELRFRRSYGDNQFRDMSDKEYEEIRSGNPHPDYFNDSVLMKKFQKTGLINKENGLLRHNFKFSKTKDFQLSANNGKNLLCKIARPAYPEHNDLYIIIATNENELSEIAMEGHYGISNEDIKYLLIDIIPGGYKEIIVLNEYYIMNGDNSDIYIYEIKNGQ